MEWSRVILHIDCDSFFVQVHEQRGCREDKTGGEELIGRPVAVWQYRDVFCVNHLARRLGIEKHSDPRKVESSLVDAGGFLIHAFYRTFPGPRVWYGPYHRASRDVFHLIRSILNPRDILEKVSIDEAYVDLTLSTNGSISKALDVAERIRRECRSKIHYVVSIGIAENRLLAKLGSVEAKPDGIYVVSDVDKLLHTSKPTKLPGLGVKMQRFQHWKTIAELQVFGVRDLMVNLEISEEAATRVFNACRGVDLKPVTASTAPKSIVLTSWVVVGTLQDLFSRVHLGRGVFPGVVVGSGYVFEPHQTANLDELHTSSGPSRIRWVLLALAMDLDERILVADEDHGIRPGKIGFQFEVPGAKGKVRSTIWNQIISVSSPLYPQKGVMMSSFTDLLCLLHLFLTEKILLSLSRSAAE